MARGDKDDNPNWVHTEEYKAWLGSMEAMDVEELREYGRVNKDVLSGEMKAIIEKLIQREQPKRRKKRALHPILGAVLKFHRDDDDTPPPGPGGANGC